MPRHLNDIAIMAPGSDDTGSDLARGPGGEGGPGGKGGPGGEGGGGHLEGLDAFFDDVLADSGVTLADDADATEKLTEAQSDLEAVVDSGGTTLPEHKEDFLTRLVERLQDVVDGESAHLRAPDLTDKVANSDLWSDEAASRLTDAGNTIEEVLADDEVDDDETGELQAAIDEIQGVIDDDFQKVSDTALADMETADANITTLLDDGFLALDDTTLALVETANDLIEARSDEPDDDEIDAIRDAIDDVADAIGAPILHSVACTYDDDSGTETADSFDMMF